MLIFGMIKYFKLLWNFWFSCLAAPKSIWVYFMAIFKVKVELHKSHCTSETLIEPSNNSHLFSAISLHIPQRTQPFWNVYPEIAANRSTGRLNLIWSLRAIYCCYNIVQLEGKKWVGTIATESYSSSGRRSGSNGICYSNIHVFQDESCIPEDCSCV